MMIINLIWGVRSLRSFDFFHVKFPIKCLEMWVENSGETSEMEIWVWKPTEQSCSWRPWHWLRSRVRLREGRGGETGNGRWGGPVGEGRGDSGHITWERSKEDNSNKTPKWYKEAEVGEDLEGSSHFTSSLLITPERKFQFSRSKLQTAQDWETNGRKGCERRWGGHGGGWWWEEEKVWGFHSFGGIRSSLSLFFSLRIITV